MNLIRTFKSSIKYKLAGLFMTIMLTIVTLVSFLSYLELSRTIRHQTSSLGEQILVQINMNLDRYYSEYMQVVLMLGSSPDFLRWNQLDKSDAYGIAQVYHRIASNYLTLFISRYPEIMSFTFYNISGNEIHFNSSKVVKESYSLLQTPLHKLSEKDRMAFEISYMDHYTEPNLLGITLAKRVGTGIVKMDVSMEPTRTILNQVGVGLEGGQAFLVDRNGNIMMHPDEKMMFRPLDRHIFQEVRLKESGFFVADHTGETVVFSTMPLTGWKTVVIVPYEKVQSSFSKSRDYITIVTIIGLFMSSILVVLATNSSTRRLIRLRKMIRDTQDGNIMPRVEWTGEDEIADLGKAYNRLLEHLNETVLKLATTKSLEQQAVLHSLQAQINSHFLYNSLESINSMAYIVKHKDIERTTLALSAMLRYTSEYTQTEVMLEQEVRHVVNYVDIMQIRYPTGIVFTCEMEEHIHKAICLKAILQPIVENSVKHVLERQGRNVSVQLRIRRVEHMLWIDVHDNGPGFDSDTLERLNQLIDAISVGKGYQHEGTSGLLNVHYRLTTVFPEQNAGIRITNAIDGGARVEIRFPYREAFMMGGTQDA